MAEKKSREIGYAEDPDCGSYEWALARVVINKDDRFVIVEESGCSCNVPGDECSGDVSVGPAATLGGLLDEMHVNMSDPRKRPTKQARAAFVDALERLNKESVEATKRVLEVDSGR